MKKGVKKIIDNIRFSFEFGNSVFSKFFVLSVTFLFPLEHLFKIKREGPLSLHLKFKGKSFSFFVRDSSDIAVLKEVFLFGEYIIDKGVGPRTIVDLGSNVGASVVYFALCYPNAQILAVEADPVTANFLRENCSQFSKISVVNYAISDIDGVLPFFVHPSSRMSSSLTRRTPDQEVIEVPSVTLKSLLEKEGIAQVDLLKFDIEGAEFKAFCKPNSLSRVNYLVGEIHLDLVDVSEEGVWECFKEFAYTKEFLSKKRFIIKGSRTPLR